MRCLQCALKPAPIPVNSDGLDHATEEDPLVAALPLLRRLPEVWMSQPLHWVPRSVRSLAGQTLCSIVEQAAWALTAELGDQRAEAATLLCRNAGMLLFRLPPEEGNDDASRTGAATAVIRRRLTAAASHDWSSLVNECLAELDQHNKQRHTRPPEHQSIPQLGTPLDDATLARAAAKARQGGLRSAASILVGGPSVPPGPETDAKIYELFQMASGQTVEGMARLEQAVKMAAQVPDRFRAVIRPRTASRIASHLKGPAGPGPSGFRNTYIQLVNDQPQGPRVLAAWASPWSQGHVKPWVAEMWSHQLCRPFFKSDAVGLRPVMCGEALFKFAAACTIFSATRSIQAAVGDFQYGASRSGGAALQLAEVHAEIAAHPDHALASLDVRNAFGSIEWADALRIVTASAPSLAPFLATIWGAGRQVIHTQSAHTGEWTSSAACGSLIQGGPEAQHIFCIVMAEMIQEAQRKIASPAETPRQDPQHHSGGPDPEHRKDPPQRTFIWVYVDDVTVMCPVEHLAAIIEAIRAAMAKHGCELQPKKCHVCVPALRHAPRREWPHELLDVAASGFQVCHESIPLLGSDAAAAHAITLAVGDECIAATVAATEGRCNKACALLDCCLQLARSNAAAGGRWPALCIARDIACRALTYDARVLPCSLVLPYASAITERAWQVVTEVLGVSPSEQQQQQAHLPLDLGGLAWPDLCTEVPLARMANIIEIGPALRHALHSRRADATYAEICTLDAALHDPEVLCLAAAAGVVPGPCGLPASQAPADPLRPPAPARHLLSAYVRRAGEHRLSKLWAMTSEDDHIRLLSSGGPVAGQSLMAPPTTEGVDFNDSEIRTALQWRLGVPLATTHCRNEPKSGGERCNAIIQPNGRHCLSCMVGPTRCALHHAVADLLADFITEAGALARREVFVPEFHGKPAAAATADDDETHRRAAYLDVWGFGSNDIPDLLVDVTIRNAAAPRYQPQAAASPGAAARKASAEKQMRYPPAGGRRAMTFALESWGRLGAEGEAILLSIRAAADRRSARYGHVQPGRFTRWRRQLDATMQRGLARCISSATVGLPGRPATRQRPPGLYSQSY